MLCGNVARAVTEHPDVMPMKKQIQYRIPNHTLVSIPSPDGKYPHFSAYIDHCVSLVGTNRHLGELLGFSSGTRVSDWRLAHGGGPSVNSCLKLAKLTDDNPLHILTMAGHAEEVAILRSWCGGAGQAGGLSAVEKMQPVLQMENAITLMQAAKKMLEDKL